MNKGKHSKKEVKTKDLGFVHNSTNNGKISRPRSPESSEESEFAFPILKFVDKTRNLHCYSAILNRKSEDAIRMSDLDRLQTELETLLSCVAVRLRTLQEELNSPEGARLEKRASLISQHKKRKLNEGRISKSLKELVKVKEVTKVDGASSENETDNSTDIMMDSAPSSEAPKEAVQENDLPYKFWAFVEPYCGEISAESIKIMEEMVSTCVSDMQGIKIPPLGEHYAIKWAKEDLTEEKDASNSERPKRRPGEVSPDGKNLLKHANSVGAKERIAGPLVQRLVSALKEETLPPSLQDSFINNKFDDEYFSKMPLFHTSVCFERRLRKELEAVGFLDPINEDFDQIYDDLKKCEEEIKIVASRNKECLSKILVEARKEITLQGIRSKIKTIDNELLEIYKRVNSAKLMKKQLQKKEKELAWRALKEREALLQSLQTL